MAEILYNNNPFGQLSLLGICVVTEEIRGQFFNLGGHTEDQGGTGLPRSLQSRRGREKKSERE
jgi:hypothetical protein